MKIRPAAALTALLVAGCSGGSSPPELKAFVSAPRVEAALVLAHAGTGFPLVAADGSTLGAVGLPDALKAGESPTWSPDGTRIAFTAATDARAPPGCCYPRPTCT